MSPFLITGRGAFGTENEWSLVLGAIDGAWSWVTTILTWDIGLLWSKRSIQLKHRHGKADFFAYRG